MPDAIEDLSQVSFKDVAWLQNADEIHGDRTNPLPSPVLLFSTEIGMLFSLARKMLGVEYVVAECRPPRLFIIHRRTRRSPTDSVVTAAYYILDGTIYQAPDVYKLVTRRLMKSAKHLREALGYAVESLEYSPTLGTCNWKSARESGSTAIEEQPRHRDDQEFMADVLSAFSQLQ